MSVEKTQFNAIKYTTKDGENITATKQDGIVTLVGDKNGVRQMPLNQFMQEFVQNVPQINNGQPKNDTVSFSGQPDKTLEGANKSKKGLFAALGLLLLAGGAYVLTRGRSSKAAKIAQEAGQEIIEQGAKNGVKAVQEVAQEVVPAGQKVVQKAAEEVVPKGQKVVTEVVEEVLPTGQKAIKEVASEVKPVVQSAGKVGAKKGKNTGEVVVDTAEKLQQKVETEAMKQEAISQLEALGLFVDDAAASGKKITDDIIEDTSKTIEKALRTDTPKIEVPKAETPEIKIPRQVFQQEGDDAGKVVKDALEEVTDDIAKTTDDVIENVVHKGDDIVDDVVDEGAKSAQKLFGDTPASPFADDGVEATQKLFSDKPATPFADDLAVHNPSFLDEATGSVDDFTSHVDDVFRPTSYLDEVEDFSTHMDDLSAHTDDMFDSYHMPDVDGGMF